MLSRKTMTSLNKSGKWLDIGALAAIWVLLLLIVQPFGEFPLNDDWNYGITVQRVLADRDFRPPTASCPLLTHALWGSLFCLPSGFSYETLRFSSQLAGFLGLAVTYLFVREFNGTRVLGLVSSLTLALNPCYLGLANTFMTDVSFTVVFTLSALFFTRALRYGSTYYILLGTGFSIVSVLNRQLALALPLGFGIAWISKSGFTKSALIRVVPTIVIPFGIYFLFNKWMALSGRTPVFYGYFEDVAVNNLKNRDAVMIFFRSAERILLYLGWFLAPILIVIYGYLFEVWDRGRIKWLNIPVGVSMLLFLLAGSLWRSGINWTTGDNLLPRGGGWIYRQGLGPFKLSDTFLLRLQHLEFIDSRFWFFLTCFGLLGSAFLIALCLSFLGRSWKSLVPGKASTDHAEMFFLLATTVIYFAPIIMVAWFDRYLVPVIPLLAAFGVAVLRMHGSREKWGLTLAMKCCLASGCVAIFLTGYLAVCGTKDYFTWNRLRWQIATDLIDEKSIDAKDINGGEEYNALSIFGADHELLPYHKISEVAGENRSWAITFGEMPGYSIFKEYPYPNCLPRGTRKLYLLQRIPAGSQHQADDSGDKKQ